jgi:hypothetical protein
MAFRNLGSQTCAPGARVHTGERCETMRALNWIACLALISLAAGCGGDSNGSAEATGGQGGSDPQGGGSDTGGDEGDAGDGAGGTTGGTDPGRGGSIGGGVPQPGGGFGGAPLPTTGGVPWMGGGPSVGPPTNCRVSSQSFSPGSCSLGFECESGYLTTSCYDQGSFGGANAGGVGWACTCSSSSGNQNYELSGAKDLAACEAVTDLCVSGEPGPAGPVDCEPRFEARAASQCQLQRVCKQELEGASGVSVATTNGVYCQDDGTGRLLCTCSNQPYQYYADGKDGMTACDALLDYCDDPVTPTFGNAEDCRPQYQSSGAANCELQSRCLRTSEIDEGIYVVQNDYVQSSCRSGADGLAVCTCQNAIGLFELEQETPFAAGTSCNEAIAVCQNIANVEPDGEPVCTNISQSAQGTYCNATLDCAASATVDGTTLSLHGYISLSCGADSSGWTCSCSSGAEYQTVAVQGQTAWDACNNASKACEDAIEVQFGNGGGLGGFSGVAGFRGVPPPVPGSTGGVASF